MPPRDHEQRERFGGHFDFLHFALGRPLELSCVPHSPPDCLVRPALLELRSERFSVPHFTTTVVSLGRRHIRILGHRSSPSGSAKATTTTDDGCGAPPTARTDAGIRAAGILLGRPPVTERSDARNVGAPPVRRRGAEPVPSDQDGAGRHLQDGQPQVVVGGPPFHEGPNVGRGPRRPAPRPSPGRTEGRPAPTRRVWFFGLIMARYADELGCGSYSRSRFGSRRF